MIHKLIKRLKIILTITQGHSSKNLIHSASYIRLGLSKGGVHVAVLQFGDVAQINTQFNLTYTINGFNWRIDGMRYMVANTRIDLGIEVAREDLMKPIRGICMIYI